MEKVEKLLRPARSAASKHDNPGDIVRQNEIKQRDLLWMRVQKAVPIDEVKEEVSPPPEEPSLEPAIKTVLRRSARLRARTQ